MACKAVILFNLGGPDNLDAVEPFLFNLFKDPAIIRLPNPFRWLIAKLISRRRAPVAQEIYAHIGGASPLLPQTEEQAAALKAALDAAGTDQFEVFICMRYWHPFASEVADKVKAYDPDEIILLPLYPQFSSTTTASSLNDWKICADRAGILAPTATLCCYPIETGLVKAYTGLIAPVLQDLAGKPARLLFSAHGLPQKIVDAGDPYQWQIEQTTDRIVKELDIDGLDWKVCYQSRVGPMKWLQPSTEDEIRRAGSEKLSLIIVPIAFVSEHSETLVELDIEYAKLADEAGVADYRRVKTVGVEADFIAGLAEMVLNIKTIGITNGAGVRICPAKFKDCVMVAS
ncbi:MAG: ferrochelatase [Sneathiella sp.]|nr:ferrochelatase [Sneathiella sp.]